MINSINLMFMNTLGQSVLVQALREAFYYVSHSDKRLARQYKESYLFIKGSGLEVTIHDYGLEYNPTELRNSFFWKVRHVKNP